MFLLYTFDARTTEPRRTAIKSTQMLVSYCKSGIAPAVLTGSSVQEQLHQLTVPADRNHDNQTGLLTIPRQYLQYITLAVLLVIWNGKKPTILFSHATSCSIDHLKI